MNRQGSFYNNPGEGTCIARNLMVGGRGYGGGPAALPSLSPSP